MVHKGNTKPYIYSDNADIVLRSSNNVEFYVISTFLCHVSLVFKDMFALSRSDNDEKKDNLPVDPITEDSETLRLLLDIIYPYEEEPQLSSSYIAWKVSKAAHKYMMSMIENKLKRQIANSKLIVEKPLSIFAIAIDLGWEEVAVDAARRTLTTPLQKLAYVHELQHITGAGFYRFLEYRHQCEDSETPQKELLPPFRRSKDPTEIPPFNQIKDILFTTASKPYNLSELSDLILRTSDGVDFYVVAALLRLSSPFFNIKLSLSNHAIRDGLAVIDVEEDSNVLLLLLNFIYPTQEPEIENTGLYAQLVFVARKYKMADIENKIKKHATASSLVVAEPLGVYAVASVLRWTSLAKTAALNTLLTPFRELSYVDEMHLMTGAHLFRLMRFRFVCSDAACDVLKANKFKYFGFGQWSKWQGISAGGFHAQVPDVLYERLKACPRGPTVTDVYDEGLSKSIVNAKAKKDIPAEIFLTILQCIQDTPEVIEKTVLSVLSFFD